MKSGGGFLISVAVHHPPTTLVTPFVICATASVTSLILNIHCHHTFGQSLGTSSWPKQFLPISSDEYRIRTTTTLARWRSMNVSFREALITLTLRWWSQPTDDAETFTDCIVYCIVFVYSTSWQNATRDYTVVQLYTVSQKNALPYRDDNFIKS